MTKIKVKIKGLPGDRAINTPFPNLNTTWTNGAPTSDEALSGPEVNHSVKPIDREHANIEAEKGELLLKPGLMGLYKIEGNPHSKGGTPLNVPEGSFIYSKDNSLALSKDEMDMFDFKRTSNKKKDNTPAKIIEREVSAKDYNNRLSTLQDESEDSIARNTAALMLAKHQEKLGQVALVQEAKKGLPNGMPEFAADAPMTNNDKEAEMLQYKKGGYILPKAQAGVLKRDNSIYPPFMAAYNPNNHITPWLGDKSPDFINKYGVNNGSKYSPVQWEDKLKARGYDGALDNNSMMDWMWNHPVVGEQVRQLHSSGKYGTPTVAGTWKDQKPGIRWDEALDLIPEKSSGGCPPGHSFNYVTGQCEAAKAPQEEPIGKIPKKGYDGEIPWEGYDLGMTPLEKLTGAMPALMAYATPTQYAMLQQKYTPNVRFDRANNTQELSDIQSTSALAQRELMGTMNPTQASGNMDDFRANTIRATNESNARMNSTNLPIGMQEETFNQGNHINDQNWNYDQIGQTYDKNVLANQRKYELRANGVAQSLNNFSDIEQNIQALEYGATAAAFPYLTHEKNADGTEKYYTGADGKKYVKQGVPFGFNDRRMPMFQPGFGDLNSFGVQAQMAGNQGTLGMLQKKYLEAIEAGDSKMAYSISQGMKALSSGDAQKAYSNPIMAMLQGAIGPRVR